MSKACATSGKIVEQSAFSSNAFSVILVVLCTWSIGECLCLNPDRWYGINVFLSIMRFNKMSGNLEVVDNKGIGLYY